MSMSCKEYREGHPATGEAARAHLAGCADCRAFASSWDLLSAYPAIEPSAGFARSIRRKLAPAAAALLVAVLLTHHPDKPAAPVVTAFTEEERELVENLDLIQNYDLL